MQYKPRVYVHGTFMNAATKDIFSERGYAIESNPELADLVVWTGGDDIHPNIYNEPRLACTYPNILRDESDMRMFDKVVYKAGLIGICRGAQLLNCLSGGSLWQDVDNHHSPHEVTDLVTGQKITINSVHHQMMIPGPDAEVVAVTNVSTEKLSASNKWSRIIGSISEYDQDPEVIYYDDTYSLCFQAHPEFGDKETTDYFFDLVHRYIDIEL